MYLIHAKCCMWGKRSAAMLAIYTGKGVAPEVNLRECISGTPLPIVNKAATLALKPRGEKSNTGVSVMPKNGHVSNKNLKKNIC